MLFNNSSRRWPTVFKASIISLLLVLATSSCQQQSQAPDERSKNLETAFNMAVTAVQDPSLHTLAQKIEEIEYTPDGVLSVMFSAFGAGTWPPPSLPSDIEVLRDQPAKSWAVVITPTPEGFTIAGYADEAEQASYQKQIAFPPPVDKEP